MGTQPRAAQRFPLTALPPSSRTRPAPSNRGAEQVPGAHAACPHAASDRVADTTTAVLVLPLRVIQTARCCSCASAGLQRWQWLCGCSALCRSVPTAVCRSVS